MPTPTPFSRRLPQGIPPWLVPGCLTGVLLWLAFPPYDLGWLAWIAPAPLCAYLLSPGRRPGLCGFTAGFIFFLGLLEWFRFFATEGWILAAIICGTMWALMAGFVRRVVLLSPPALGPLLFAATWTVVEWLRSLGPFGFPWGMICNTQHGSPAMLQGLELTGPYGLSFLVAFCGAALAASLLRLRGGATALALGAGIAAVQAAGGALVLAAGTGTQGREAGGPGPKPPGVRTAVVQASTTRPSGRREVETQSQVEDYLQLTAAAVAAGARLVVWPESTLPSDISTREADRVRLAGILPRGGWLVGGAFDRDPSTGMGTNSVFALTPGARILGRYDKVSLVPYGEFVPGREFYPWIASYGVPAADLAAGPGWRPIDLGEGLRVGAPICFESAFPAPTRRFAANGATLMCFVTSDGWADRTGAALQNAACTPLRAVETRRSIARSAATGISEFVDPCGRVLETIPLLQQGYAVRDLELRSDRTWYVRLGDWPVGVCLAILAAALCRAALRAADSKGRISAGE